MKVKTSELIGSALDWAVAICEGRDCYCDEYIWFRDSATHPDGFNTDYSGWELCGPIIEREKVGVWPSESKIHKGHWGARMLNTHIAYGPTPLIAAMRCYCCAKLGDEIEIPQELQPCQQPKT